MKNRRKVYITLGILVAVVPLLGFPNSFRTILLVFLGLLIAGMTYFNGRTVFTTSVKEKTKKEAVIEIKKGSVELKEDDSIESSGTLSQ